MTPRTRHRLATIALAPAAALAAWALIRLAGIDLVLAHHDGTTVGPLDAVVAAAVGGVVAWPVVSLIERHSRHPRRRWAQIGSTALALSLIGPNRFADGSSAVALIGLHVVTAVVVITGFIRTLPVTPADCTRCAPRWLRNVRA